MDNKSEELTQAELNQKRAAVAKHFMDDLGLEPSIIQKSLLMLLNSYLKDEDVLELTLDYSPSDISDIVLELCTLVAYLKNPDADDVPFDLRGSLMAIKESLH